MPFDHLPLMDDNQVACLDMASGKSEAFVYRGRGDCRSPMNASAPSALSTKPRATFPIKRMLAPRTAQHGNGDVLGYVLYPAFGGIEGDHP